MNTLQDLTDEEKARLGSGIDRLSTRDKTSFKLLNSLFYPLYEWYTFCYSLKSPRIVDTCNLKHMVIRNPLMLCDQSIIAQEDAVSLSGRLLECLFDFHTLLEYLARNNDIQPLKDVLSKRENDLSVCTCVSVTAGYNCTRCGNRNMTTRFQMKRPFWLDPQGCNQITNETEWSLALSSLNALCDGNVMCAQCPNPSHVKKHDLLTFQIGEMMPGHRFMFNVDGRFPQETYHVPSEFTFGPNRARVIFVVMTHPNSPFSLGKSGHYTGALHENGNLHFLNDGFFPLPLPKNFDIVSRFAYQYVCEVIGRATQEEHDTLVPLVTNLHSIEHSIREMEFLIRAVDNIEEKCTKFINDVLDYQSDRSVERRNKAIDLHGKIMSEIVDARKHIERVSSDTTIIQDPDVLNGLNPRINECESQMDPHYTSLNE